MMHLISIFTIVLMACRIQAQTAAPASGTDSVPTADSAQNTTTAGSAPAALDASSAPTAPDATAAPTAPDTVIPAQNNTTTTANGGTIGDQGLTVGSKNPGGQGRPQKEPVPVSMTCEKGWMPLSPADLAAMANNGTNTEEIQAKYSSIVSLAACRPANENVGGMCAISSCDDKYPVCSTCSEMIFTSSATNPTIGNVTVNSVNCVNNYFFGAENGTVHNVCTDGNKAYSCTGACTGYTTCKLCASGNDTALQGP